MEAYMDILLKERLVSYYEKHILLVLTEKER